MGPALVSAQLPQGRWLQIEVPAIAGAKVWLEAEPGSVPCVESIQVR
jgi:hypothetical protein